MKRPMLTLPPALAACLMMAGTAQAAQDFSFTGYFVQDDNVQLFDFSVGALSNVTLRTWSYAGGVNAAGQAIDRGGFDPILALFDSSGALIDQNDDGACGDVDADPMTGVCFDTYLSTMLDVGTYTVAVMQYDNFANGPNLADGFSRQGQGNFTAGWCAAPMFCDVSGVPPWDERSSHWAFDILNVEDANPGPGPGVPEPATWAMLIAGFGMVGAASRRRSRALHA